MSKIEHNKTWREKITKKDVDKIDFKKILNKETEEEDG